VSRAPRRADARRLHRCRGRARTAVATTDPVAYPRDYALDLVNLADILAQRCEVDESASVGVQAAELSRDLDSGRVSAACAPSRNGSPRTEVEPASIASWRWSDAPSC
jgi:hypothetical protein